MSTSLPDVTTLGAVLFDLDGVLTPTAEVHQRAWGDLFSSFLAEHGEETGTEHAPWTDQDYFDHVDGRPRLEGIRTFLASRGIDLPEGSEEDAPGTHTVHGLGLQKNSAFLAALERDGVDPYPGSLALLEQLAAAGTPVAVVSSSANATEVLAAAGIDHFFEVVVDGRVARAEDLPGKPAPDTFLAACARLEATPDRAAVVEDATSGCRAGAAGGFAHVVGVDRGAGADALREAGATTVVADLQELVR
ncbi:HAD family hydrolase [Kytococcus sedentarius]|uniref:HAD family hydrolase n=1 Tax=Kytococcus sedentarius TaxID=1276 RepID=UPI0019519B38|nr:beta-phosphoglucomutase family hydrolase [Kytococcus sedentarius]QRO86847.1 beta-phosphoglucomutase family hydrolase [Kytococcus sedentarius]